MAFIARKDFPARNFNDFVAYVKTNREKVVHGHPHRPFSSTGGGPYPGGGGGSSRPGGGNPSPRAGRSNSANATATMAMGSANATINFSHTLP
jgi:hypothetical protein